MATSKKPKARKAPPTDVRTRTAFKVSKSDQLAMMRALENTNTSANKKRKKR